MNPVEFNYHLRNIKESDESIEKLYDFYYSRIIHHFENLYGYELSRDIAQEFFIKLITVSEKQGFVSYPTAWVYACCENIAKRKISCESKYVLSDVDSFDAKCEIEEVWTGDILYAIRQLDDVSQRILKLFYWEGYNQVEISRIIGINPATIRKKHSRAIKKIKKLLNDVTKTQS